MTRDPNPAIAEAIGRIAPAWPLHESIGVNPHWQRIHRPVRDVAARLWLLSGQSLYPSRDYLRRAEGRLFHTEHLQAALARHAPQASVAEWRAAGPCDITPLPLLIDVLDCDPKRGQRLSWRDAITHQVSQTCAAYFDHHQAQWQTDRGQGLYAFWRELLVHDWSIGAMVGLDHLTDHLNTLPLDHTACAHWVLSTLNLPAAVEADYLEAVLLTVNGWASWCAYLNWKAGAQPRSELHELLSIRMAFGVLLLNATPHHDEALSRVRSEWAQFATKHQRATEALWVEAVGAEALDLAAQDALLPKLASAPRRAAPPTRRAQVVCCIDVRSERLRRAIERVNPAINTHGFAGFFGLAAHVVPLGSDRTDTVAPGLLAPTLTIREVAEPAEADRRRARRWLHARWEAFKHHPLSGLFFVESWGLGCLLKLLALVWPSRKPRPTDPRTRYELDLPDGSARADLAQQVLWAMGLRDYAPWVVLLGHGAQAHQNAHAATYACGACGGHDGTANAQALAHLLNDSQVRAELAQRGVPLPATTRFVAALHNTTTDEVHWAAAAIEDTENSIAFRELQNHLRTASELVRAERSLDFGFNSPPNPKTLLQFFELRANDGAENRPEWGLAKNHSLILAERSVTQHLDLNGRCFLHDYDPKADPEGRLLELLMSAPMVVAHWINWQYHASFCTPKLYGSGNKILHNVVGGHLGVFEGNGGDLRIGLSHQALYREDQTPYHEPLRLNVIIHAEPTVIDGVLAKHPTLKALVDHAWLHLFALSTTGLVHRLPYSDHWRPWQPCATNAARAELDKPPAPPALNQVA